MRRPVLSAAELNELIGESYMECLETELAPPVESSHKPHRIHQGASRERMFKTRNLNSNEWGVIYH